MKTHLSTSKSNPRSSQHSRKKHIAVIIVNWNSADCLARCVEGLLGQSLKPDRILIIDNSSTDNSIESVKSSASFIEVVHRKKNFGFANSNNFAAAMCGNYQWLALVNPDTASESDWLENLMNAASRHPEYSMFACKQVQADRPEYLDGTGDCYHVSGLMWRRDFGRSVSTVQNRVCEVFSPCGGAMLISRKAFEEAGGFDEDFFCYTEDVDLGFRLRLLGHRCLYVPSSVIHHAGSASAGKKSDFSIYHGHRNLVWTFFKNMPFSLLVIYLPQHLFLNLFSLIWFFGKGRTKVILKAKQDALKGMTRMLRKRRNIQSSKRIRSIELLKIMHRGLPKR